MIATVTKTRSVVATNANPWPNTGLSRPLNGSEVDRTVAVPSPDDHGDREAEHGGQ